MYHISCSIVLYNSDATMIRKPIESFLNCAKHVKLFLVDNSAEDTLRYQFISPQIEYIFNGRNLGYGAGHNLAIQKAKLLSSYHLVLNPDIEFNPNTLEGLFDFMQNNPEIGLVMPKVLYRSGETQYLCKRLPSPSDLFLRRFIPEPVKFVFKKFMQAYEMRHRDYDSIMEVPNLSGCFMFMRTEVFSKVGLFDERYFLYLEDTDLCRRINEHYKTIYYPMETIIHGYEKASYKDLSMLFHHMVSSLRYFNKWGWFNDRKRIAINHSIDRPMKEEFVHAPSKASVLQSLNNQLSQKVSIS